MQKALISGKEIRGHKKQPAKANKQETSYSKYFLPSILMHAALVFTYSF